MIQRFTTILILFFLTVPLSVQAEIKENALPAKEPAKDSTFFKFIKRKGRSTMRFKVGMKCPKMHKVNYLAYTVGNQEKIILINRKAYRRKYKKNISVELYSRDELEKVCRDLLASVPDAEKSQQSPFKITKKLISTILVEGKCTSWKKNVRKAYPVSMIVNCVES